MKEFLGIGGYTRTPEGAWSVEHISFVSAFMITMVIFAIFFGRLFRNKSDKDKNKVIIASAILIDFFEIAKILLTCFVTDEPSAIRRLLPLFLCSIQLIALPIAAFSKGRLKEAALDFVCIFGILGAVFGTVGATQNYACYPVFSFVNVVSAITHSISGFASLYIIISGMASMKIKNMKITFMILFSFCALAYVANITLDYNYMFLMSHDGTPYSIIYNLVGQIQPLYSISVVLLFVIYIYINYAVFKMLRKNNNQAL